MAPVFASAARRVEADHPTGRVLADRLTGVEVERVAASGVWKPRSSPKIRKAPLVSRALVARGVTPDKRWKRRQPKLQSGATAYRYLPNHKALLVTARPRSRTSHSCLPMPAQSWERPSAVVKGFTQLVVESELQQRTMLRLALEPDNAERELPLRQGRAIDLVVVGTRALVPEPGETACISSPSPPVLRQGSSLWSGSPTSLASPLIRPLRSCCGPPRQCCTMPLDGWTAPRRLRIRWASALGWLQSTWSAYRSVYGSAWGFRRWWVHSWAALWAYRSGEPRWVGSWAAS